MEDSDSQQSIRYCLASLNDSEMHALSGAVCEIIEAENLCSPPIEIKAFDMPGYDVRERYENFEIPVEVIHSKERSLFMRLYRLKGEFGPYLIIGVANKENPEKLKEPQENPEIYYLVSPFSMYKKPIKLVKKPTLPPVQISRIFSNASSEYNGPQNSDSGLR